MCLVFKAFFYNTITLNTMFYISLIRSLLHLTINILLLLMFHQKSHYGNVFLANLRNIKVKIYTKKFMIESVA